jgi:hypothetical protein
MFKLLLFNCLCIFGKGFLGAVRLQIKLVCVFQIQ